MDWIIRKLEDILLPIRLFLGRKYMYDSQRVVVKIWPNLLVKGPVPENEYEALLYVSRHTTVPVPKVRRVYRRSEGLYIEREFVEGVVLDTIWNDLSYGSKREYVAKVWSQLEKLRSYAAPSNVVVASTSGGPVKDGVFSDITPIGPFSSFDDFKDLLRKNPNRLALPPGWDEPDAKRRVRQPDVVLTNGDISPRNIIVCQDGRANSVCIFDWEMSGWWPAYWEKVKWHFGDFPTKDMDGWMEGWVELMDEESGMAVSS